jgi:hypothetical protein
LEKLSDFIVVFGLCRRMGLPVFRTRYKPKLFRLPGGSEIPQTIISRYNKIALFVNNQQGPRADFANDIHGPYFGLHQFPLLRLAMLTVIGAKGKAGRCTKLFEASGNQRVMEKFGDRQHLILRIAITACQNYERGAIAMKKPAVQKDVIRASNLNALRMQAGIGGERPL